MERPPKPDLLYGPRALSLDAFISSLEAWGKQGWDCAEGLEAERKTMFPIGTVTRTIEDWAAMVEQGKREERERIFGLLNTPSFVLTAAIHHDAEGKAWLGENFLACYLNHIK